MGYHYGCRDTAGKQVVRDGVNEEMTAGALEIWGAMWMVGRKVKFTPSKFRTPVSLWN